MSLSVAFSQKRVILLEKSTKLSHYKETKRIQNSFHHFGQVGANEIQNTYRFNPWIKEAFWRVQQEASQC